MTAASNPQILSTIPLSRILAGKRHAPVVYFARVGEGVKIGTTTNLKSRMQSFYVRLENVVAVIPGGRATEAAYHRLFADLRIEDGARRELFRLDGQLKHFLSSQTVPVGLTACVSSTESFPAAVAIPPVTEMGLSDMVTAGLVRGSLKALRMDRHRSDLGELPEGLRFPEPVGQDGQKELFNVAEVLAFDAQRRGARLRAV